MTLLSLKKKQNFTLRAGATLFREHQWTIHISCLTVFTHASTIIHYCTLYSRYIHWKTLVHGVKDSYILIFLANFFGNKFCQDLEHLLTKLEVVWLRNFFGLVFTSTGAILVFEPVMPLQGDNPQHHLRHLWLGKPWVISEHSYCSRRWGRAARRRIARLKSTYSF